MSDCEANLTKVPHMPAVLSLNKYRMKPNTLALVILLCTGNLNSRFQFYQTFVYLQGC